MRFLCLVLSLFALGACGRADAATTDLPTLVVEYAQGDSARVVASWRRPCDGRGCADSYRVQWTAGGASRVRTVLALADTLFVPRPAFGDSLVVAVGVTSLRRGLAGATRSSMAVVRNPDAAPPAVDSLRADTLTALEAERDSFPVLVARDTLGRRGGTITVGESVQVCGLGRNRYTGDVRIFVPADAPADADAYLERVCERARLLYAAERDG